MFKKPVWAKCDDRNDLPNNHEYSGTPDDWFSDTILPGNYTGVSFDFFVNWKNYSLSDEIWIKTIVDDKNKYWPHTNKSSLEHDLYKCESKQYVERLGSFAKLCNLNLKYQLFKESKDWGNSPQPIVTAAINSDGKIASTNQKSLRDIKQDIQRLSGGIVNVGEKGLTYSPTTLECYLSRGSGAAWPGDVDLIILDKNLIPLAILEYKKNTKAPTYKNHVPISQETLSRYYPKPDKRKYDRLAILRDFLKAHFKKEIPIFNIYFPTWKGSTYMKIEHIIGKVGHLQANPENVTLRPLPKDKREMLRITMSVLTMI
ncbi:hypothetical protein [Robertmurraya korlensis]|uniref:hypothetical protein n=1 Tax=Robertmurraya korlensis TaxID=519977 RepID=UPI000824727C|nr:hypothetical protein [Robertmurraya korlensis]